MCYIIHEEATNFEGAESQETYSVSKGLTWETGSYYETEGNPAKLLPEWMTLQDPVWDSKKINVKHEQ